MIATEPMETIHLYYEQDEEPKPPTGGLDVGIVLICLACFTVLVWWICSMPQTLQTIIVPAHFLPARYFSVPETIIPTGIKTYPAVQAQGILTITNGSILSGELPKGMILTGNDGVEVVTDTAVFIKEPVQADVDPSFCVGIDLGVTNLAAIASNREGFVPRLVNGRPVKAWNQWYNKRMKALKNKLPKAERERVTRQMERITNNRNRQVNHYLHTASKRIVDFLVQEGIGTVIIGKNPFWKQETSMSKRNNQNFVQIPHARFIDMLTYKAELVGIQVEVAEESYTSKASFLDLDSIPTYKPNGGEQYTFSGKRIGRRNRLYCTKDGRTICADVNGAYNILRKSRPDAFAKGVAAYVVQPVRLSV